MKNCCSSSVNLLGSYMRVINLSNGAIQNDLGFLLISVTASNQIKYITVLVVTSKFSIMLFLSFHPCNNSMNKCVECTDIFIFNRYNPFTTGKLLQSPNAIFTN